MRKKVFIYSPFRGDMEGNAKKATEIAYATEQGKEIIFKETEGIPVNDIPQSNLPTINGRKSFIRTETNQSYQLIHITGGQRP